MSSVPKSQQRIASQQFSVIRRQLEFLDSLYGPVRARILELPAGLQPAAVRSWNSIRPAVRAGVGPDWLQERVGAFFRFLDSWDESPAR